MDLPAMLPVKSMLAKAVPDVADLGHTGTSGT